MPWIHLYTVNIKYVLYFLYYHFVSCFDSVGSGHRMDIITVKFVQIQKVIVFKHLQYIDALCLKEQDIFFLVRDCASYVLYFVDN